MVPAESRLRKTSEDLTLNRIGEPYVPRTLEEKKAWVALVHSAETQFEQGVEALGVSEEEAALFRDMLGYREMYDYAARTDHTL